MADDEPYVDPSTPTDERVEDLLSRMTVAEKAAQLSAASPGAGDMTAEEIMAAVADGEVGTVSPTGVALDPGSDAADLVEFVNAVQQFATEQSRLGIPVLTPTDATHGHAFVTGATVFPHGLGVAATREPALARELAAVTAREMRATGVVQTYTPTADVTREPRWGRTFETYGESPHLTAAFVAAETRGYGDEDVAATAKHFPAYGEPSRGEDTAAVDRSPAHVRRTFLPPFRAAIEAGVDSIMPSYNSIDGVPVHASEHYLREVLRDELGFEGPVVSDWGGVEQLHEDHRVADAWESAVRLAAEAGLDVASLGGEEYVDGLVALVENGDVEEAVVDESVRRVLRLKFDLGLFEDPYADAEAVEAALLTDEHRAVAETVARRSMTLLRNEDDALPFEADLDAVAVVGPNADDPDAQCGGWTGSAADDVTTVRQGVEAVVGESTAVRYEEGATVREPVDVEAAADAAADADAAVVVCGEDDYIHEFIPGDFSPQHVGEFPRRQEITLPDAQRDLLRAVVETGTPTALVLVTGRPLATPWAAENVPAILMAYYPGIVGGTAVAETLFGEHDPSGRLPVSVPRSAGHLPTRFDYLPHPSPIDWAHQPSYDPLFAFGHGLTYADFARGEPSVEPATAPPDGEVTVEVEVENVGDRPGRHSLDVFVRDEVSSRVTPVREWRGATAVDLAPGESETAAVTIDAAALGVVHPDGSRPVEPGEFAAIVGDDEAGFEVTER